MFSTSPESPPLFIVDPTVLSRQLHRNNNLCVSERHDPRTEVARRPIWTEVARIRTRWLVLDRRPGFSSAGDKLPSPSRYFRLLRARYGFVPPASTSPT